jgi:plasmid stability protein
MAVSLSVKNVPEELAERLRRRAARNHRSLQRELLSILEAAAGHVADPGHDAVAALGRDTITIEELVESSRKLFPQGTESSVELIRQMRDSR